MINEHVERVKNGHFEQEAKALLLTLSAKWPLLNVSPSDIQDVLIRLAEDDVILRYVDEMYETPDSVADVD